MGREANRRPSALTVFFLALTTFVLSVFAISVALIGLCEDAGSPGGVEFCGAMRDGGTLAAVFGPSATILLVGLLKPSHRLLYGTFGAMTASLTLIAITVTVAY